ncbi:MAG TPA: 50S ribosomal protein L21 [Bdellovibrionota bacterium]|nr:50S ribosomal protein L21 [Bdellovibrionota bacterium]
MQAVIRLGSHQYEVSSGDTLRVEKIDAPVGSEVRIKDLVMLSDGETVKVGPEAKGTVVGVVRSQGRAPKLIVFKKKRRKGYTRTQGHRQLYTTIEITKIEA